MTAEITPPGDGARRTLVPEERVAGVAGPPPLDDRTEIRWSRTDGVDVVVKAGAGALRDHLRREAEVLQRCAGLPTVDLLEVVEGADHTELVTARFGLVTLHDARLLSPTERGATLVGLCRAVDALHGAGWAHGSVASTHVLVEPGRGVRLCSLAAATPVIGRADGDGSEGGRAAVRDDRAALAAALTEVLEEPATFGSRRSRRRWDRSARRAVARVGRLGGLPTGEELAAVLAGASVPGATPPDDSRPGSDAGAEGAGVGRRVPVGVVAALMVLAATGCLLLARWWTDAPAPDASRVVPVHCARQSAGGTGPAEVDVDGDGCPETVTVAGGIVTVGDRRYRVGLRGDVVAVGDWDCDGRATVAALRPSTGEVFDFHDWATSGTEALGRVVTEVDGAVSILAPVTACGPPSVLRADGTSAHPDMRVASTAPPATAPPTTAPPTTVPGG